MVARDVADANMAMLDHVFQRAAMDLTALRKSGVVRLNRCAFNDHEWPVVNINNPRRKKFIDYYNSEVKVNELLYFFTSGSAEQLLILCGYNPEIILEAMKI